MSTFKIIVKPQWFMLWLMLVSVLFVLGGKAEAALNCDGCHGTPSDYRPLDSSFRNPSGGGFKGNHRTHMSQTTTAGVCVKCHSGSDSYTSSHRNVKIEISPNINSSPAKGTYSKGTFFNQTSNPVTGTCSNVNCHFEKETINLSRDINGWGSSPLTSVANCNFCHGAPPQDGHHPGNLVNGQDKHGNYLGTTTTSCNMCHSDHTSPTNFTHATSAGHRPLVVQFTKFPNGGGTYSGYSGDLTNILPSQRPTDKRNGTCSNYCHSDGRGGAPNVALTWSDTKTNQCYFCHKGRATRAADVPPQITDNTPENCATFGVWSSTKGYCTPDLTMSSDGHQRLAGVRWVRQYPCYYCHNKTVAPNGTMTNISSYKKHVNGKKDVVMASRWNIVGRKDPSYDTITKTCDNVYCHSDGTTNPEQVRLFAWTDHKTECNSCHGHPTGTCNSAGCHDRKTRVGDPSGKIWTLPESFWKFGNQTSYAWAPGQEWKAAVPMFSNQGAGQPRANSHSRHVETNFTCDSCHGATIKNGTCTDCHKTGIPPGGMSEVSHIDPTYHVNKTRDIVFKQGGSYNSTSKTCSSTFCHTGIVDPIWGGSVNSAITCLGCHGTNGADIDDFDAFNGTQAKINTTQWVTTGHGRYSTSGRYPSSNNPAANFPGNPCWYCHDNSVIHKDAVNPLRLRQHTQFQNRFDKECVYCHMERTNTECISCHVGQTESLSPQATTNGIQLKLQNGSTVTRYPTHTHVTNCINGTGCHDSDSGLFTGTEQHKGHNANAGIWSPEQKKDVKNQYMMMGVCLQCHDDDSGGKCTSCHQAPANNPLKYSIGFDPSQPGSRLIKPKKARATSAHFGYKHYRDFINSGGWQKRYTSVKSPLFGTYSTYTGTWKGGKFCWDCHDPHGDSNIFMIQSQVATTTDGTFGRPLTRSPVVFTQKKYGTDYATYNSTAKKYTGICNVCHSPNSKHYTSTKADGHNSSKVCTICHQHRFTDSHADGLACNGCHLNKPVPRHSGFGLPRDCTKCHTGTLGKRMDIMGQFGGTSHHVQGSTVSNKHCYACHWESTPEGVIDIRYHEGYNFKTYTTVRNAKVDLVVWQPDLRPIYYNSTTAVQYLASRIGTIGPEPNERSEVTKLTKTCIGCHSDQNNDSKPFDDCKTPRQYAWDRKSIDARYNPKGITTTPWSNSQIASNGKGLVTKALSAHGNAVANQGGWNASTGLDNSTTVLVNNSWGLPTATVVTANITNLRNATQNVQCYDCHSSHGSKLVGVTSSYVTFNGTRNGGNLKETVAGTGGYGMTYTAKANSTGINPYNAGAGQCFDCHFAQNSGATPWGYNSTFGVSAPIKGYFDTDKFGDGAPPYMGRYPYKTKTMKGGHFKASSSLGIYSTSSQNRINGLCTPCHDPHGVSPSIDPALQKYAVPMLKGTWMTSPYNEDAADISGIKRKPDNSANSQGPATPTTPFVYIAQTFSEDAGTFAGLCLQCHPQSKLNGGTNTAWKGVDRIHNSVKGWGGKKHAYTCSKCHVPHVSATPRLTITNCLDYKHNGRVSSGGSPGGSSGSGRKGYGSGGFPAGGGKGGSAPNCHPGYRPDNYWNSKTPWP